MRSFLYLSLSFITFQACAQQPEDSISSTFYIELSSESCNVDLKHDHVYEEKIDEKKGIRIITANGIPSHKTGQFPNQGNPNTIAPQKAQYEIPLEPKVVDQKITAQGKTIGVLFSGVEVDPFTNEFFQGKKGQNREWNITTLTTTHDLGLDCNNAHVQPGGKYHYHGTPNAYLDEIGVDGSQMIKIGYAADGYPIYYKYGYDSEGEIIELSSAYALKEGNRPGDGKSAPEGPYDGTYFQDYEYQDGLSELDECNGRVGKTPESQSEYYYVITDNFPSSPICFSAEPSQDFIHGGGPGNAGPPQGRPGEMRNQNGQPNPAELMRQMDTDRNGKISKTEARGPLQQDFDRIDTNGDGFIDAEELGKMRPPRR
jgi:hypothetical protein